ncbi:hypothetical protein ACI2KD_01370 [Pseudomonas monteilii]|jgi:hypothetical protein
MWVLNAGRKSFLEFLRNTSAQFFIMLLVAILLKKLDILIAHQDTNNIISLSIICALVFVILLLAAIANIKAFFLDFKDWAMADFNAYVAASDSKNVRSKKLMTVSYLLKNKKIAFLESCLLIAGIYFFMVVGLFHSIESAHLLLSNATNVSA